MPRANRHHLASYVWHITQCCHRKQFLLKFARDRRAWMRWLYEARKRHGLCVWTTPLPATTFISWFATLADLRGRFDRLADATAKHGALEADKKAPLADAPNQLGAA